MSIKSEYITEPTGEVSDFVGKNYKGIAGSFLDFSNLYLPKKREDILLLAEYFYMTNPILRGSLKKLAEYALTELVFDSIADVKQREKWREIMTERIDIRGMLLEAGVNFYCYGENFTIPYLPFTRYYKCKRCGHMHNSIRSIVKPKWRIERSKRPTSQNRSVDDFNAKPQHSLIGICSQRGCNRSSIFEIVDTKKTPKSKDTDLRFLNIHPRYIEIKYNPYTGDKFFYMGIEESIQKAIKNWDWEIFDFTQIEIIQAIQERKPIRMKAENVYHFKNSGLTSIVNKSHGESAAMSTFKDLFFVQMLKHVQEIIARDRPITYRAIFPSEAASQLIDLSKHRDAIEAEIKKWRDDPNHIAFFSTPVEMGAFSGEAKNLFLAAEISAANDNAIVGLEVPREFVYGNIGAYSGASVSMRMLENRFLAYVSQLNAFLRTFVIPKIATHYSLEAGGAERKIKFQSFKMADDTQQKQLDINLTSMGALSKKTLLHGMKNIDYEIERDQIKKETIDTSRANAEAASLQSAQQIKDQIDSQIKATDAQNQIAATGKVQSEQMFAQDEVYRSPEVENAVDVMYKTTRSLPSHLIVNQMVIWQQQFPFITKRMLEKHPDLNAIMTEAIPPQPLQTPQGAQQNTVGQGPHQMPGSDQGAPVDQPLPEQKPGAMR